MLVSEFTEAVDYAIETRIIVNEKYEFEDFVLDDSFATQDCGIIRFITNRNLLKIILIRDST